MNNIRKRLFELEDKQFTVDGEARQKIINEIGLLRRIIMRLSQQVVYYG